MPLDADGGSGDIPLDGVDESRDGGVHAGEFAEEFEGALGVDVATGEDGGLELLIGRGVDGAEIVGGIGDPFDRA